MATISLEYAIEQFGIEACQKHPMLKRITKFHEDEDREAETDCLVFKATKGKDYPAGNLEPGRVKNSSDVLLEITYRSSTNSSKINEAIANAIDESFRAPYATRNDNAVSGAFDWMVIEDDKAQERSNQKNSRHRVRRIPFGARLANTGSMKLI